MDPTLVVIGKEPCETSTGPLAVGESVRVPVKEALTLAHANQVTLADWHTQQAPPAPPTLVVQVLTSVEAVVDAITPKPKRKYRRRDLQAEQS